MQNIQRLQAVVGSSEARLVPAQHPWFKRPGVYVQTERDGNVYYVVPATGSPRRVTKEAAEEAALVELGDVAVAANEAAKAQQARDAARADGFEASPLEGIAFPTALDCLQKFGAEFEVFAEQNARLDGTRVPGWRNILRRAGNKDGSDSVLHVATDAYEIVPQRVALSLLDRLARLGNAGIRYRFAWASREMMRVRAPGEEKGRNVEINGRRVGLSFDVPSVEVRAFAGRVHAGGSLVTSHDGSTAIRATACLTFAGITIFHVNVRSWRHSSKVATRLAQSKEAFSYLVNAARSLVRDAEATINVPDDEAADVVLRATAPELFEADPAIGSMPDADRAAKIKAKADKLAASRKRLHDRARAITSEHKDVFLGGFRYVLAAPSAFSNRAITAASYYDGLARERMTAALVALARHAGMVDAGIVPELPVEVPEVSEAGAVEGAAPASEPVIVSTSVGSVIVTEPSNDDDDGGGAADPQPEQPAPGACSVCGGSGLDDMGDPCACGAQSAAGVAS